MISVKNGGSNQKGVKNNMNNRVVVKVLSNQKKIIR